MPKTYAPGEKEQAFNIFMKTGSISKTAQETDIGERTLYNWAKDDNWKQRVDQAREELRKVLEEKGLADLITKDEEWLRISRILFGLALRPIRTTNERGEPITPEISVRSIGEVINLLRYANEIQDKVIGKQEPETAPQVTDEQAKAIYKILLGDKAYDADEDRRRKAEEFRNRQA